MNVSTLFKWVVAMAAALTIGTAAWALPMDGPALHEGAGGADMELLMGPVADALNITDAQKEKIRAIFREEGATMLPLLLAVREEQKGLRAVIQASPVDEQAIRGRCAKIAAIEVSLAIERALIFDKVRPILSAIQLERLQKIGAAMEVTLGDTGRD